MHMSLQKGALSAQFICRSLTTLSPMCPTAIDAKTDFGDHAFQWNRTFATYVSLGENIILAYGGATNTTTILGSPALCIKLVRESTGALQLHSVRERPPQSQNLPSFREMKLPLLQYHSCITFKEGDVSCALVLLGKSMLTQLEDGVAFKARLLNAHAGHVDLEWTKVELRAAEKDGRTPGEQHGQTLTQIS